MKGLDTSIVARVLTKYDPDHLRRATEAIGTQSSTDDPGWINCIVLVEVVWVLSSAYRYSRGEIVVAIEKLLQVRELEIQYLDDAWEARQTDSQAPVLATSDVGFYRSRCCFLTHTLSPTLHRGSEFPGYLGRELLAQSESYFSSTEKKFLSPWIRMVDFVIFPGLAWMLSL